MDLISTSNSERQQRVGLPGDAKIDRPPPLAGGDGPTLAGRKTLTPARAEEGFVESWRALSREQSNPFPLLGGWFPILAGAAPFKRDAARHESKASVCVLAERKQLWGKHVQVPVNPKQGWCKGEAPAPPSPQSQEEVMQVPQEQAVFSDRGGVRTGLWCSAGRAL